MPELAERAALRIVVRERYPSGGRHTEGAQDGFGRKQGAWWTWTPDGRCASVWFYVDDSRGEPEPTMAPVGVERSSQLFRVPPPPCKGQGMFILEIAEGGWNKPPPPRPLAKTDARDVCGAPPNGFGTGSASVL